MSQRGEEEYKSATREQIFSCKSQSLEERYQSYLKGSPEESVLEESGRKKGVRTSEHNLIHEYEH